MSRAAEHEQKTVRIDVSTISGIEPAFSVHDRPVFRFLIVIAYENIRTARRDLADGSQEAARRAKIPVLDGADIDHLAEIFAYPGRIAGVEHRDRQGGDARRIDPPLVFGILYGVSAGYRFYNFTQPEPVFMVFADFSDAFGLREYLQKNIGFSFDVNTGADLMPDFKKPGSVLNQPYESFVNVSTRNLIPIGNGMALDLSVGLTNAGLTGNLLNTSLKDFQFIPTIGLKLNYSLDNYLLRWK